MKVPKPAVGVDAEVLSLYGTIGVGVITHVDYTTERFAVKIEFGFFSNPFKFRMYHPAPTMNNFLRAIEEWDYHYRAADDPRVYEEGKEYEQALIELFKQLPDDDKYSCRKIVEIVVMSTESK